MSWQLLMGATQCAAGNFITWALCVVLSTKARAALGLQGASLVNALRGRAVWANRGNHYLRMW